MVRALYGIVSTGGQAGFALDKLTELMAEDFPDAYKTLRENRYVDDILSWAETKKIRRKSDKCSRRGIEKGKVFFKEEWRETFGEGES